ncbi:hypothetical protein PBAC_29710 [Pedobacter glucosidilyticus]|nr:hypothetical protein [Pedobacter glucosidilyticus]KHJ36844.1 hypothetical protein PBAC_29710 [Pedobacter glucosidilyticus]
MKPIICIIIFFVFGFLYCTQTYEKVVDENNNEDINGGLSKNSESAFYVKNKTLYNESFLAPLSARDFVIDSISIVDNYFIEGKDTTYFPEVPSINKILVFNAINPNKKYILKITRTNYTDLNFNFKLTDKSNKVSYEKSGQAILTYSFLMKDESKDKESYKDGYRSFEYRADLEKLFVTIVIYENDRGKKSFAKIEFHDKDQKNQNIDLNQCPTLWEE